MGEIIGLQAPTVWINKCQARRTLRKKAEASAGLQEGSAGSAGPAVCWRIWAARTFHLHSESSGNGHG